MKTKTKALNISAKETATAIAIPRQTVKTYEVKVPLAVPVISLATVSFLLAVPTIVGAPLWLTIIILGLIGAGGLTADTGFRYEYMKNAIIESGTTLTDFEEGKLFGYGFLMGPFAYPFKRHPKPLTLENQKVLSFKRKWSGVYIEEQVAIDSGEEWDKHLRLIDPSYVSPPRIEKE